MAFYPNIVRPCPYKGDITALLAADTCSLCKKKVHDLSGMTDEEKQRFLASNRDACVSDKVPLHVLAASAAMAAAAFATSPAAAQALDEIKAAHAQAEAAQPEPAAADTQSLPSATHEETPEYGDFEQTDDIIYIIVGGYIRKPVVPVGRRSLQARLKNSR
ncbi:MAG: hypothetical protein CME88_14715 [Hirschia sp.]|nr:hypothetical protein [Hirschia sp.]